jgi:transcriptional regulator with XRE-family HTH domain
MENLSDHIRILRIAQGFSQDYVAKRLHVSQQSYSLIERSPEECSLNRLKDLAKILNVEFLALIGEDETIIQTNVNQSGGNAATKMVVQNSADQSELILHLKSEIEYLRNENTQLLFKLKGYK